MLLKLIAERIPPQSGKVALTVPFAMLGQHLGMLRRACSLRDKFLCLNPSADARMDYSALARFGSRATDPLLHAGDLSGGERLRASLGSTLQPMLSIHDEPTNQLDLYGIAALGSAHTAYDGAMLMVGHDRTFLKSIRPDKTIELKAGTLGLVSGCLAINRTIPEPTTVSETVRIRPIA